MISPDFARLLATLCRRSGYIGERERLIKKWGYVHFQTMQRVAFWIISIGRQDRYLDALPHGAASVSYGYGLSDLDEPKPWLNV